MIKYSFLAVSAIVLGAIVVVVAGAEEPCQQIVDQRQEKQIDRPDRRDVRVLTTVKGKYGLWEVLELDELRVLVCDGVIQGAVAIDAVPLSAATLIRSRDYIGLVPFYRPRMRSALVIGLGAGIHARALGSRGVKVHSVDIEPAVVPLAEKYFGFTGSVTVADGRAYLNKTSRRFDAIILDTFQGGDLPSHLYTTEAFQQMSDCLQAEGVLAIHLIARPQHPATKAVARTVSTVFPEMVCLHSNSGSEIQHIYLLASHKSLVLESEQMLQLDRYGFNGNEIYEVQSADAKLLTDGRTDLNELSRDLAKEHRRNSLKTLRRLP